MAKRRGPAPAAVPDALRDAVERTMQATQVTRDRAQDAVDELVRGTEARAGRMRRGAETGAESVRERVRGAMPATTDDVRELRSELRAIGRRLDAIEERLPAKRSSGSGSRSGSGSSSRARKTAAAQRTAAARKKSPGRGSAGASKQRS